MSQIRIPRCRRLPANIEGPGVREPAGRILPPEIHKNTKLRVAAPKKHKNIFIIELQTQLDSPKVSRTPSMECQNCEVEKF